MATVSDVLKVNVMAQCRLVAGSTGLDRRVRSVTVMEVPDVYAWIREGEIVLTTLYALKDDPRALSNLVPEMADHGIAALAIKPRRYVDQIPEVMVDQAERLSVPLIEIPDVLSHSVLLEGILNFLGGRSPGIFGDIVGYQKILDGMLNGLSIPEVIQLMGNLLGNPVSVFHNTGILVLHSNEDFPSQQALAHLNYMSWEPLHPFSIPLGTLAWGYRGKASFGNRVVSIHKFVSGGDKTPYSLVVWEWRRALSENELFMINQVSRLIFFELDKANAIQKIERRYRAQFCQNWMKGEMTSIRSIQQLAKQMGWHIEDAARQVMVIGQTGPRLEQPYEDPVIRLEKVVGDWMARHNPSAVVFAIDEHVVVTSRVPLPGQEDPEMWSIRLIQAVGLEGDLAVGIGRVRAVNEQSDSYKEALTAFKVAAMEEGGLGVRSYESLGIFRLLAVLAEHQELEAFMTDYIRPITDYDDLYRSNLLKTLQYYLDAGCSVRKASQKMFVHYNTAAYRLSLIETLTGKPLSDPVHRLALHVGVQIQQLSQIQKD